MARTIVTASPRASLRWGAGSRNRSRNRKRISANRRQQVFERDGHRCTRCGSKADLTVDHDIPLAKGGTNALDNLRTLCGGCNFWKADKLV